MDHEVWKSWMTIAIVFQMVSGACGVILSLLIRKRVLLVIQHILIILFAVIGLAGYKYKEKHCILIHGFCTIALSLGITVYELIAKSILGQLNFEIFFLLPFIFDIIVGIPSFVYIIKLDKPDNEYSEIPATTYQGYLTQNLIGASTCCICSVKTADYAAVPCGHKCLCNLCMERFTKGRSHCPICRKTINELVKIYE